MLISHTSMNSTSRIIRLMNIIILNFNSIIWGVYCQEDRISCIFSQIMKQYYIVSKMRYLFIWVIQKTWHHMKVLQNLIKTIRNLLIMFFSRIWDFILVNFKITSLNKQFLNQVKISSSHNLVMIKCLSA